MTAPTVPTPIDRLLTAISAQSVAILTMQKQLERLLSMQLRTAIRRTIIEKQTVLAVANAGVVNLHAESNNTFHVKHLLVVVQSGVSVTIVLGKDTLGPFATNANYGYIAMPVEVLLGVGDFRQLTVVSGGPTNVFFALIGEPVGDAGVIS